MQNEQNNYSNLNENEILVLKAIATASELTGGDFTYFDEVVSQINALTQNQVKGYISQLSKKNYIYVDEEEFNGQISAGDNVDYLTDYKFN